MVIEPYTDAITGSMVMSMVAPIYKTGTSDLIGFVGIDITIDQLYETMESKKIGETGFCILATADGQLIYHPDSSLKAKRVTESNMSKNVISAIQNKTAGAITYTAMNQTIHGYLSTVGTTGWTVTTGLPDSEFNSFYSSTKKAALAVFHGFCARIDRIDYCHVQKHRQAFGNTEKCCKSNRRRRSGCFD